MSMTYAEFEKMVGPERAKMLWAKANPKAPKAKKPRKVAPPPLENNHKITEYPVKVICPLFIEHKGKNYYLSMNQYRNWEYWISNALKKEFERQVFDQCKRFRLHRFEVEYQLYYPDKRKRDKMNFASVVSKFFLDTLTKTGAIVDDSDAFVKKETVLPSLVDKDRPRCEVTLYPISDVI